MQALQRLLAVIPLFFFLVWSFIFGFSDCTSFTRFDSSLFRSDSSAFVKNLIFRLLCRVTTTSFILANSDLIASCACVLCFDRTVAGIDSSDVEVEGAGGTVCTAVTETPLSFRASVERKGWFAPFEKKHRISLLLALWIAFAFKSLIDAETHWAKLCLFSFAVFHISFVMRC